MKIKLISYNIWHGKRLEEAINFLRKEKADVLCLQEVATSGLAFKASECSILTEIQEAVDMEAVYVPMFSRRTGKGVWDIGVAVMSKHKIVDSGVFQYAGGYKEFNGEESWHFRWPSAVLAVRIEGLPFVVATTHVPVTINTQVTKEQMEAAAEVHEAVAGDREVLLCGDMNTLPDSGTYKILVEGFEEATNHAEQTLHPTIHKVGNMGYHVDYLFYRGKKITSVQSRIPVVDGSDHLPVVAEIGYEV